MPGGGNSSGGEGKPQNVKSKEERKQEQVKFREEYEQSVQSFVKSNSRLGERQSRSLDAAE